MRLPILTYEEMSSRQRELYDLVPGRHGTKVGAHSVWLHSPEMAARVEALGAYARTCSLSKKLLELCILVTARFWDAQYSWNNHQDAAIAAGISPEAIKAMAEKRPPLFLKDDERVFFNFAMELLQDHFVSDQTFAEAQRLFGDQGLVDIVGCIGNFSMVAMVLNAFQVDLQTDCDPPYSDVKGFEKVKSTW